MDIGSTREMKAMLVRYYRIGGSIGHSPIFVRQTRYMARVLGLKSVRRNLFPPHARIVRRNGQ